MPLNHPETSICVKAERAFLERLEGGSQVPIAEGRPEHAESLGVKLAEDLLARGAREMLSQLYNVH